MNDRGAENHPISRRNFLKKLFWFPVGVGAIFAYEQIIYRLGYHNNEALIKATQAAQKEGEFAQVPDIVKQSAIQIVFGPESNNPNDDATGVALCGGVVVRHDGNNMVVATAAHCLIDALEAEPNLQFNIRQPQLGNKEFTKVKNYDFVATTIKDPAGFDLALIALPSNTKFSRQTVPIKPNYNPQPGEPLCGIALPDNYDPLYIHTQADNTGDILQMARALPYPNTFAIKLPVIKGESGFGMFTCNQKGELVGVLSNMSPGYLGSDNAAVISKIPDTIANTIADISAKLILRLRSR